MRFASILAFSILLTSVLHAQFAVVVPNAATSASSGSGLNTPVQAADRSYQYYIHRSQLTGLNTGDQITSMQYRLWSGATVAYPAAAVTWPNYNVQFSESSAASFTAGALASTTFASNQGAGLTSVRTGALSIPAGTAPTGNPAAFVFSVPFSTPYTYTAGTDIVIMIRLNGSGGGTEFLDSRASTAGVTGALSATTFAATTGTTAQAISIQLSVTSSASAEEINIVAPTFASVANGGTFTHDTPLVGGTSGPAITFTIQNQGPSQLTITSAAVTGTPVNCSPTVSTSAPGTIAASSTAPFGIDVNPASGAGVWSFQFTVDSSDANEASYVVTVQGTRGLSGVRTVNLAGGGDYTDIGAAFDDLEDLGVAGPYTIEVSDAGGDYTANASYFLGLDGAVFDRVQGTSATNTVAIVAAAGSAPRIVGAPSAGPLGLTGSVVLACSFITFSGFEIVGTAAAHSGLAVYGDAANAWSNITIARCKVSDVGTGNGILVVGNGSSFPNFLLENNMVRNCSSGNSPLGTNAPGSVAFFNTGANTVIRHNTIVCNAGVGTFAAAFGKSGGGTVIANMSFNVLVCSTNTVPILRLAAGQSPVTVDRNVMFFSGGAIFHSDVTNFPNFGGAAPSWQASGRDVNGLLADPLLTSATDLHILAGSPAIGLSSTSTTTIDIDGHTRLSGQADSGADEFTTGDQEIDVDRGGSIPSGNTHNIGNLLVATPTQYTWDILNQGATDDLDVAALTAVPTGVTNCTVNITSAAAPFSVTAAGQYALDIDVTAGSAGAFEFTITITSDDADEGVYTVIVQGTGFTNAPPTVGVGTSNWVDAGGGLFTLTVSPGDAIADTLVATDPTPDNITVDVTTTPTFAGLTSQPVDVPTATSSTENLTWTGTADGSNAPGNYDWVIEIDDGVSTVTITARIIMLNVAPQHTAVTGITGDGLAAGTQYVAIMPIGSGAAIDFADLTDDNVADNITVSNQNNTAAPAGTTLGFTFSTGGSNPDILTATPNGTAALADLGNFDYNVDITDGTNTVTIFVRITVSGTAPNITSGTAPATAVAGIAYSHQFVATGNPAPTFAVTTGTLPGWATLTTGGLLSGTPVLGQNINVTVSAQNGIAPDATQAVNVTVIAGVAPTFTSGAPTTTATAGTLYSFTFTATGTPTPTLSAAGLPLWLTFNPGTGVLSGTPAAGDVGTAGPITITAANGVVPDATVVFSIVVSAGGGGGGGGGGKDGGGGCSTDGSNFGWMLLLGLLATLTVALRLTVARRNR